MPVPPKSNHPSTGGFSVIELLVVIAIFATLLSLTLGGMGVLRRKNRQLQCMGNLREIGVAVFAYAGDNAGTFPGPVSSMQRTTTWKMSDKDRISLPDYLAPYLGIRNLTSTPVTVPQFVCAAAKAHTSPGAAMNCYIGALGTWRMGEQIGSPLGYRASGAEVQDPMRISYVEHLSATMLLMDLDGDLLAPRGIAVPKAPASPVHAGVRNVLFADGHVEAIVSTRFHWRMEGKPRLEIR